MSSYSNKIRYTGSSGIDVESLVEQLMTAESAKKDKVYKQKTLLEWKQTAMRSIGNNVKTFQNKFLSFTSASSVTNMRSSSAYSSNTATVTSGGSTSTGVSAKASYNATTGTRSVEVVQTAQGEKRVSSEAVKGTIQGNESVDFSSIKEGDYFNVKFNGTSTKVTFSEEDVAALEAAGTDTEKGQKLQEIVQQKLTDKYGSYNGSPKVQFTVDSENKVSLATAEGVGGSISFSGFTSSQNSTTAFSSSDLAVDADGKFKEDKTFKLSVGGTDIELKTMNEDGTFKTKDELVSEINSSLSDNSIDGLAASVDKSGNIIMTSDYNTTDKEIKVSLFNDDLDEFSEVRTATLEGSKKALDLGIPSYQASNTLNKSQTLSEAFGSTGNIDFTINGKSFSFDSSVTTIDDAMNQINKSGAGVSMAYDSITGNFSIASTDSGATADITFGGDASSFFSNFNIDVDGAATQAAQDSIVKIDGVQMVNTGNSITYDNVTYDVSKATAGTTFEVSIETNATSAFDNIKNFVNEYNTMIAELQNATSETRTKYGSYTYYEPLTDDEKSAMSDTEIEKYEAAAKTGVLNRDANLQKLTSKLREAMNTPVTLADGSKMYLYELGISTGDYTKGAQLEIDEDKLKSAIEERGADVATLFTSSGTTTNGKTTNKGIMELVNDAITDAVGTTGYISEYAGFENTVLTTENTLSKKIAKYDTELSDLADYLADKETYYYKMFAAMEEAITASNSDMSYISSFTG
ncbi:MAG: flagellar filament capping protein FliD [Lachnospirales bacterium]